MRLAKVQQNWRLPVVCDYVELMLYRSGNRQQILLASFQLDVLYEFLGTSCSSPHIAR